MDDVVSRHIIDLGDRHQLVLVTRGALDAIAGQAGLPIDRVLDEFGDIIDQHAHKLAAGREPNEVGLKLTAEVIQQQA